MKFRKPGKIVEKTSGTPVYSQLQVNCDDFLKLPKTLNKLE